MSRIDEIEARLAAATPGPWEAVTDDHRRSKEHSVWADSKSDYVAEWVATRADADLLANTPADLAALVKFARDVAALHVAGDPECPHPHHDPVRCPDAVVPCAECDRDYPCPTARALAELDGGAS